MAPVQRITGRISPVFNFDFSHAHIFQMSLALRCSHPGPATKAWAHPQLGQQGGGDHKCRHLTEDLKRWGHASGPRLLILICVQKRQEQEREIFIIIFFFFREGRCPRRALLNASHGKTVGLAAKCAAATPHSDATCCSEEQPNKTTRRWRPSAGANQGLWKLLKRWNVFQGSREIWGESFQVSLCNIKENMRCDLNMSVNHHPSCQLFR